MKHRISTFAAPLTVIVLSALAGCSETSKNTSPSTAGTSAAGVGVAASGTGAATTAGTGSAAGTSAAAGTGTTSGTAGTGTAATAGTTGGGAAGTASAAGTSGGPTAGTGSATDIPATFETVKLVLGGGGSVMPCAAAPCHGVNGAAPPARPLELPPNNDQQLYTNLTTYVSKACGDLKLVTPGNPAQSAILKILTGPCGMTPRMPYGCSADAGDCIPDEYVAAVRQWIMAGAPQK